VTAAYPPPLNPATIAGAGEHLNWQGLSGGCVQLVVASSASVLLRRAAAIATVLRLFMICRLLPPHLPSLLSFRVMS
jgi:hypothetical protein